MNILAILADGRFHSGEALGAQLGVTRAAVWKGVEGLKRHGISVQAVPGRGYRLAQPLELLDVSAIMEKLSPRVRKLLDDLSVEFEVSSTNDLLRERVKRTPDEPTRVLLAEVQTAGKGRRGRRWVAAPCSDIICSFSWRFEQGAALSGISLAVGVAVAEALVSLGVTDVQLKWPNDIWLGGRKLAGVLVEVSGEANGTLSTVVGLGLNLGSERPDQDIEGLWTYLGDQRPGRGRNIMAAHIVNSVLECLDDFTGQGFLPFRARWERFDALRNRSVTVETIREQHEGIARGIDGNGLLNVEIAGELRRFAGGEVSLRAR